MKRRSVLPAGFFEPREFVVENCLTAMVDRAITVAHGRSNGGWFRAELGEYYFEAFIGESSTLDFLLIPFEIMLELYFNSAACTGMFFLPLLFFSFGMTDVLFVFVHGFGGWDCGDELRGSRL